MFLIYYRYTSKVPSFKVNCNITVICLAASALRVSPRLAVSMAWSMFPVACVCFLHVQPRRYRLLPPRGSVVSSVGSELVNIVHPPPCLCFVLGLALAVVPVSIRCGPACERESLPVDGGVFMDSFVARLRLLKY